MKTNIRFIGTVNPFPASNSLHYIALHCLESQETELLSLLLQDLEVLEDGGDSQENSSARANGADEVSEHGESSNAHSSEQGGGGNVAVEHVNEGGITVTLHGETVITQLLGHVASRGAGELDPQAGDGSAGTEHVDDVDDHLEGIGQGGGEGGRGREVVDETADGTHLLLVHRPLAEETDEEVGGPLAGEHLGDDHEVGAEGGDDDDGGVAGVEQLDGVQTLLAAVLGVLHGQLHAEALEVDHHEEHHHGGKQVGDVGQTGTVEGVAEGAELVLAGEEEVEEGDDGSLELLTTTVVHGGGGEGLPHHRLAHVGGDEQGDAGTQTVALGEHLVQQEGDDAGEGQLEDEQGAGEHAELASRTVHARDHVDEGSADGEDDSEQLLHRLEQGTLLTDTLVEDDNLQTSQQLHDHGGSHNRADSELHNGTSVNECNSNDQQIVWYGDNPNNLNN